MEKGTFVESLGPMKNGGSFELTYRHRLERASEIFENLREGNTSARL
jgi:hypothetical protein